MSLRDDLRRTDTKFAFAGLIPAGASVRVSVLPGCKNGEEASKFVKKEKSLCENGVS